MGLQKLIAALTLGTSLLLNPISTRAEDLRYSFNFSFGSYKWGAENTSKIFDDSFFIKSGFSTKIAPSLLGTFSLGYIPDEETFSIGKGISETCKFKATYFEALLSYEIPIWSGTEVYAGAGVSAMVLDNEISTSDFRKAIERGSGVGIPLVVGMSADISKDKKTKSNFAFGINLSPFDGVDISGTYFNAGLIFRF